MLLNSTLVLKWALNSILQSYEISLGVHFPYLWHLYFMFCPTLFSCVHLLTFHMLHKETEALSWEPSSHQVRNPPVSLLKFSASPPILSAYYA